MKRLNQSGFGMSTLLVIIVVLILFIIIFSVIALNSGLEKGSKSSFDGLVDIEDQRAI